MILPAILKGRVKCAVCLGVLGAIKTELEQVGCLRAAEFCEPRWGLAREVGVHRGGRSGRPVAPLFSCTRCNYVYLFLYTKNCL